ncbi:MAG: hypothetical protein A3J83_03305 [Elusimicrobia bacterium RIFOXYA2_FULL_40_6]|nr:MAG: hypothetical protein A3J83_03305 [Elusimicrobia bacterium RIFOXYA2_FULL_40_6]
MLTKVDETEMFTRGKNGGDNEYLREDNQTQLAEEKSQVFDCYIRQGKPVFDKLPNWTVIDKELNTGENILNEDLSISNIIKNNLLKLFEQLEEMIEDYEDEIARDTNISFLMSYVNEIWEHKEYISMNSKKLLMLVEVALKYFKFQTYTKKQLEIVKNSVNCLIANYNLIDDNIIKETKKIFVSNKIDIYVALKPNKAFLIEVKEIINGK